MDRQNREKASIGGGGIATDSLASRQRRERLKQLAYESFDVTKDPYAARTLQGSLECKLCSTFHRTEGSYMAHTQGKRHQWALLKRAEKEKIKKHYESGGINTTTTTSKPTPKPFVKVGRPGYRVVKFAEGTGEEEQRGLLFELHYPEIETGLQPRHCFMNSREQKIEKPDSNFQYLLFAARPYETIGFKIPSLPLDTRPGKFVTSWNKDTKTFTLRMVYKT
jgi:splicing factor 3A subunit 2